MNTELTKSQDDHDTMRTRLLEVDAEIAEASRAYFADGISLRRSERAALIAESKRLQLELHKLNIVTKEKKRQAMVVKARSMLALLIDKCVALGRQDLVDEARAESLVALEAAGLLEDYRS